MTSGELRLRPLRVDDEDAVRAAQQSMAADEFEFVFDLTPGVDWSACLARLERDRTGIGLAADRVPATFLVAEVDGRIVGRSSIRHELTDFLRNVGGHIGYGVLPQFRRRGYATEMLRQSVIVARSLGVGPVLVTCDDDNAGSVAVIEACGGRLVSRSDGPPAKRRYWID